MTCGTPFAAQHQWDERVANSTCPCSFNDIGARFTSCSDDGTKSLIYYYKPPATCKGGVTLPATIHDIPCDTNCDGGEFFDAITEDCRECEPGTYSPSQRVVFESFRDEWPSQFDTYCVRNGNDCEPWQLRGDYVDSGNNYDKHSVKSTMVYSTEVEEGSVVSFEYMVFGEIFYTTMYDYLDFTIRNSGGTASSKMRASLQDEWKRVEFEVEPGFVEFIWTYTKDAVLSSTVPGGDRAKIRNIDVSKTVAKVPVCISCPKGTFSNEGSSECMPCPPNTYAPDEKSSTCLPCPAFTRSFGGAVECEPANTPCTTSDYYTHPAGDCVDGKLLIQYHWIHPQLCNDTHAESVLLPPDQEIDCPTASCHPGQEPSTEAANKCQVCEPGKVSRDGSACDVCELGSVPNQPTTYITHFEGETDLFRTGCSNQCQSRGWRFMYDHADSGVGNGISESWIETTVEGMPGKSAGLSLDFTLQCSPGHGEMQILVNDGLSQIILCDGCTNATRTTIVPLAPSPLHSNNTIRINYRTFSNANINDQCNRATIQRLVIIGEPTGGSTDCVPCLAGEKAENGVCKKCPAGTHSPAMSNACEPCPANSFSSQGSADCHPCGGGMTSSVGSSRCEWKKPLHFVQTIGSTEREFDFSALAVQLRDKSDSRDGWTYYLNLDAKTSAGRRRDSNSNSPCGTESFVCRVNAQGEVEDLGNSASFQASFTEDLGLVDMHAINYDAKCNGTRRVETRVYFTCNLAARNASITAYSQGGCDYWMNVVSRYSCPLCSSDDYISYNGLCQSGVRPVHYTAKGGAEHVCFGGYAPPTNVTITTGCNDVVISSSQWWIVLIVFACVGGIAILFFTLTCVGAYCTFKFYSKYRTVEIEKQQLLATRQNVELADEHVDEMDKHDGGSSRARKREAELSGSTNRA